MARRNARYGDEIPAYLRLVVDNDGGSSRDRPRGGRVPPNDIEAEAVILSGMMFSAAQRAIALWSLTPESFYSDNHRLIFGAIKALDEAGELEGEQHEGAVVQVASWLRKRELIQRAGGANYLGELLNAPATGRMETLCRTVADLHRLRRAIAIVQKAAAEGYGPEALANPERWVRDVGAALTVIADDSIHTAAGGAKEAAAEAYIHTQKAHDPEDVTARGLEIPIAAIQKHTSGLYLGETLAITARSGGGKTLLAGQLIEAVAAGGDFAAGMWSLEMPKRQIVSRLAIARARLSAHAHRAGRLPPDELAEYNAALDELAALPMFFDEHKPRMGWRTVESILSTMRRYHLEAPKRYGKPLGLMVLDFVQKLDCSGVADGRATREYQLNIASDMLVRTAEEIGIALVLLCQTNDDGAIRESKAVTHHVHSWWKLTTRKEAVGEWYGEIDIPKARHGGVGSVPFAFDPRSPRFHD